MMPPSKHVYTTSVHPIGTDFSPPTERKGQVSAWALFSSSVGVDAATEKKEAQRVLVCVWRTDVAEEPAPSA